MELVGQWYVLLSQLSATLSGPLGQLTDRVQFPLVNALLLGLIGTTAPCQLTTNLSAIAYISRGRRGRQPWQEAVTYTLGKALVYTIMGGLIIGLGLQIQAAAVPVVVAARKLLGPIMLLIGLVFLGWLKVRMSVGQRLAEAFKRRLSSGGPWGAFAMGVVFAFAFCPTLFLLFFGLTIPLGLGSSAGLLVPGLFAVGTALPLLLYAGLLAAGAEAAGAYARRLSRSHTTARKIAGGIFLLAGINDTVVYWLI
ncbi:MAG TPA: sulfite exporter TauE/SafE family protein [Candidatus Methylomirabilis sp.]|nr:sulfite exporter TauE/SafE family protein [Candidatus Methylomirabilis sp.]HSC71467.1 sulfite exporter TauE/SafE family protein [Candidatus Methylomirabilis sp.]